MQCHMNVSGWGERGGGAAGGRGPGMVRPEGEGGAQEGGRSMARPD